MFLRSSGFNGVIQGQNKLFACKIINNSELVLLIIQSWFFSFSSVSADDCVFLGMSPDQPMCRLWPTVVLKEFGHKLLQTFARKWISGTAQK